MEKIASERSLHLQPQVLQVLDDVNPEIAPKYEPVPLQDSLSQIRLLYINPGTAGEAITCTLITCNIDKLPPFRAISYTWGDPRDS